MSDKPAITRIEEITEEISIKLDAYQNNAIDIGALLIEAKEELLESGKKYQDFLDYCADNFNIGKAQASKLMRVSLVFTEDTRFKGVAMRVLYALATGATPEQMDKAAEFAENGTLNTAVVNQLLHPRPVSRIDKPASNDIECDNEALEEALSIISNLPGTPKVKELQQGDNVATVTLPESEAQGFINEIAELRKLLDESNAKVIELLNKGITHNKKAQAPLLPQFTHKLPYVVLGLSKSESLIEANVRKAFRSLVSCGYCDGHEAFCLLKDARDKLIKCVKS